MKTTIEELRLANWEKIEADVVEKIRALRQLVDGVTPCLINDKIASDLILPSLTILGQFCASVKIEDE